MRSWSDAIPVARCFVHLGAALTLAGAGCAAHVSPSTNLGSPDSTGMVVLACVTEPVIRGSAERQTLERLTLGAIRLENREPVAAATIAILNAPNVPIHSSSVGGVLVFTKLKPGMYRIRTVLLERVFLEKVDGYKYYRDRSVFVLDPRSGTDVTFHVDRGGLTYVGDLVITAEYEPVFEDEVGQVRLENARDRPQYRIEPNEEHEAQVWRTLLRWYRQSAWEESILGRIHALEGRGPSRPPHATSSPE